MNAIEVNQFITTLNNLHDGQYIKYKDGQLQLTTEEERISPEEITDLAKKCLAGIFADVNRVEANKVASEKTLLNFVSACERFHFVEGMCFNSLMEQAFEKIRFLRQDKIREEEAARIAEQKKFEQSFREAQAKRIVEVTEEKDYVIPADKVLIPKEISKYVNNLSSLTLEQLEEMKKVIGGLDLNPSQARGVWEFIAKMIGASLEELALCKNAAEVIQLVENQIAHPLFVICSKVPFGLKYLQSIEKLPTLEKAKHIEESMKTLPEWQNLTYLDLGKMNLRRLPAAIDALVNLESLNLTGNKLREFPTQFYQLPKLKTLMCSRNCFEKFPSEMVQLKALEFCDMSGNLFTTMPADLAKLPAFQCMFMSAEVRKAVLKPV